MSKGFDEPLPDELWTGSLIRIHSFGGTVTHQQAMNKVALLPIVPSHVFALSSLPAAHKAPFDRLLIAQAIGEGLTIVSSDSIFSSYPVRVLW